MVKEYISLTQLFVLIFNFLLGSSIVIGIRKRCHARCLDCDFFNGIHWDWVDVFVLQHLCLLPNKNLFEILEYCFTRRISIFFSLGYVIYFLHASSRVTRTFGEMITTAILPNYPFRGYYSFYYASNGLYSLFGDRGIGKSI